MSLLQKQVLTFAFLILFFWTSFSQARVLEKIYAIVNGEIITLSEIKDYQYKLKNGGFLNDLLFSDPEEREKASKNRDYLLKLLVDEKIIDFEVKRNGFLITEERVNKEITTIAKRQNMNVDQLRQTLAAQAVNYDEYRDFVKKSIERRQLVEKEITSKIKISEQDIVSHYLAKSGSNSNQIFEFSLSHILFKTGNRSGANKVIQMLKDGKNFEKLAAEFSSDGDTKKNGGKFGDFKSGEMISSIEEAIQPLEIGDTSQLVKTPMGLHIFKILDKKLVQDPEIERQKKGIYQQLFSQAFKEQLNFWLNQKRKEAIIQINKS
ncbi:MAG: peptidylprolyl isomerase [Pseudomonadota bacterium]